MKKVFMVFDNGSFANVAEKKKVMLACYKAAIGKMYDMKIFPASAEIDLGASAISFTVRANEEKKVYACLDNLSA